ncbi:cytosolic sulfotransferase 5-like [Macadamia integrifolia]|uniref:cytosolic sulfotransferase 5-like n=1 Tax=Macadamia integrifolia TaxID=60698 RepID=UPI001C4EB62C|nr:cytosolic sulfotransferase 5-like [Macadamia integrifolia]
MADNIPYKTCFAPKSKEEEEEDERIHERLKETVATLPTIKSWFGNPMYQYQSFWYSSDIVGIGPLAVQDHFKAHPTDILIAATPKCGTTWLKSLVFAVMNRKSHSLDDHQHPLHKFNSHDLVPTLEIRLYNNNVNGDRIPNLDILSSPRLLATHMPYTSLPQSVRHSGCRIVYICRNTNDTLVSYWHFINKLRSKNSSMEPLTLEETFELFCKGISEFGPFWDHVLGYWKASLERPQSLLFLKYDEMQVEPVLHLKRMAEFMGCPFSSIEEKEGVVDQIIKLCSFENLSNLAVNTAATNPVGVTYSALFRKGKVGDSTTYLTHEMMEQLDRITEHKLQGSGLTL